MSGRATFSDAIAATTAPRARQTTAVMTPWRGEVVASARPSDALFAEVADLEMRCGRLAFMLVLSGGRSMLPNLDPRGCAHIDRIPSRIPGRSLGDDLLAPVFRRNGRRMGRC